MIDTLRKSILFFLTAFALTVVAGCSSILHKNDAKFGPQAQALPPVAPVRSDADKYAALTQAASNGSVQIFSLDTPPAGSDSGDKSGLSLPSTAAMVVQPLKSPNVTEGPAVQTGQPESLLAPNNESVQNNEITQNDMKLAAAALAPASVLKARGVPYALNPSVEVFPLDGEADAGGVPILDSGIPAAPSPQFQPPAPEPGVTPPAAVVASADNGWSVEKADSNKIYFKNGSSSLSAAGLDVINQVAANAGKNELVRVEGHASKHAASKDPVKRHLANLKVSMQRAITVSQALIKKGVPAPNIKTTAWGDTQPPFLTDPGMDEETAARRVEIFMQPQ